jgi:hypothetical protein
MDGHKGLNPDSVEGREIHGFGIGMTWDLIGAAEEPFESMDMGLTMSREGEPVKGVHVRISR